MGRLRSGLSLIERFLLRSERRRAGGTYDGPTSFRSRYQASVRSSVRSIGV
jgi:hypothetical protein